MTQVVACRGLLIMLFLAAFCCSSVFAQDMRRMHVRADEALKMLEKKAAALKKEALASHRQEIEIMKSHRKLLEGRLKELQTRNRKLKSSVSALAAKAADLEQEEEAVSSKLRETAAVVHELVGIIRMNARDINTLVSHNLQSALFQPDTEFLQSLLEDTGFPGMNDVRQMVNLLKDQIEETGWVVIQKGDMVGRDGRTVTADILLAGPFTAAWSNGEDTGFLSYSPAGRKFYALSNPAPSHMASLLHDYMQGLTDDLPVDISLGAAVRELSDSRNLWEQIKSGGPVVWPIAGVFIVGLLIIIERMIFLFRTRVDSAGLLSAIENAAEQDDWKRASDTCRSLGDLPLPRVLLSGLDARILGREELENVLQESILGEIPAMERFLSSLGMLAAIAPLLGLLGTVTGMINTFHVITVYGTGDPRLMSAGISEALVTTMLGLTAAIPLFMGHNLLGGAVDRRIADMEEKSVALVNLIIGRKEIRSRH